MKFSLKLILAITLLAALTINGVNNRYEAESVRARCVQLKTAITTERYATRSFAQRKLVYQRASEAFERRKAKLDNAPEFFQSVARAHGKLGIEDTEKVHIFSTPGTATNRDVFHERFRIWLPESNEFELCLGFHETGHPRTFSPKLRNSYYFQPKEQFTFRLQPGETLVEFLMPWERNSNTVELKVNGVVIHQASRKPVLSDSDIHFETLKRKFLSTTRNQLPESFRLPGEGYGNSTAQPQPDFERLTSVATSKNHVFDPDAILLTTANYWPSTEEQESVLLVVRPIENGGDE